MRIRHLLAAVLVCIAAACAPASAQRQPTDNAGPEAVQRFHEQHRYTFQLLTMATEGLVECERWKSTAIRADQAKKILSVLQSLTAKPKLSQDQARSSIRDLRRAMDQSQLGTMDRAVRAAEQRVTRLQSENARRQQAGQRPSGSGRQAFDPARMRDFNPFCPSTSSPRYQSDVDRNYKLLDFVKSRAEGRNARLSISAAGPPLFW